jgi:formate dehydrogenase major subunit
VNYARLGCRRLGNGRCNDTAPDGSPIMHVDGFVRGKGKFVVTAMSPPTSARPRFPLLLTTGRILSQYNVGAQTRRTENSVWHAEDLLEIHPTDAGKSRDQERGLGAPGQSLGRNHAARDRDRSRGAGRGLYHVPPPRDAGQRGHHRLFRLGDQLPGIQGYGGAVTPSNGPSEWQEDYAAQARQARRIAGSAMEPAE